MKTPKLPLVAIALFILAFLLLGGCGFTQGKKDAEAVLVRHFQAVSTNGFSAALADYGAQFFQNTTKDQWAKVLAKLSDKLGAYQGHTVTGWNVASDMGTGGTTTIVSLQCQVTYSKQTATESFTLRKGVADADYKIIGHQISSAALLTD
jgi:hypothetical protein